MSKVNAARQGYLTKSTIPSVTRVRGPVDTVNGAAVVVTGNGANGDASQRQFQDRSGNNYPLHVGENVTLVDFGPFANNGGQSFNLNGYSGISMNSPAAMSLGTGDFTIECWVRSRNWSQTTTIGLFFTLGTSTSHLDLRHHSGQVRAVLGTTDPAITGSTMAANTWYHLALVRSAGNTKLYIDGTQSGSTVADTRNYACRDVSTGFGEPLLFTDYSMNFANNSPNAVYGWVSNLRVCNVAVYTGNFSRPSLGNLANTGAGSAASYSSTTNVNTTFASSACLLLLAAGGGDVSMFADTSGQGIGGAVTAIYNGATSPSINQYSRAAIASLSPYSGSPGSLVCGPTRDTAESQSNAVYTMGTGDFTYECWVYLPGMGSSTLVFLDSRAATENNVMLQCSTGNTFQYVTGTTVRLTSNAKSPYTWYHVALVKISSVVRLYINGVSEGGTYSDLNSFTSTKINMGGAVGNTDTAPTSRVYISDVRVLKGVGAYTGNFTPPTARLGNSGASSAASYPNTTNVNTSFASSACSGLFSMAMAANSVVSETEPTVYEPKPIYTNGVTVSTAVTKTGTGSLNFGNSATGGTSVYIPGNWSVAASTNFSVEGWFYFNTYTGYQQLWCIGFPITISGQSSGMRLMNNGGTLYMNQTNTSTTVSFNFGSLNAGKVGQWQHIAVVRVGSAIRCYVDGVQLGSDWTNSAIIGNQFGMYIGNGYSGTSGAWPIQAFRGYIDDFRLVTTATAYAQAFTPPTTVATSNVAIYTTTTNTVYGMYQNF